MSLAQGQNLSLGSNPLNLNREYGSHRVGDVYATGNARIFLGNADRVHLCAGDDGDVQSVDGQKRTCVIDLDPRI